MTWCGIKFVNIDIIKLAFYSKTVWKKFYKRTCSFVIINLCGMILHLVTKKALYYTKLLDRRKNYIHSSNYDQSFK